MVGFIYILHETPFYVHEMTFDPMCDSLCSRTFVNFLPAFCTMLLVWAYKMLPPLRCMTLLGPPYFVYPCERREFELELLGMANLCPSAITLFTL